MKSEIKKWMQEALQTCGYTCEPEIEISGQPLVGDYASNLAFQLAKELKKNPKLIAENIAETLSQIPDSPYIVTPLNGFLNIKFKEADLKCKIINKSHNPISFQPIESKILLEYVSANPTGPLHIGHGRWAILGNTLERLLKTVGFNVDTEFYINDTGNQVALFYDTIKAIQSKTPLPENGYHGHYMVELAAADKDPLQANIDSQRAILNSVNVHFKTWFSEKSLHVSGAVQKTLQLLKEKDLSYEKDGALWFKSEAYGDDKDRVIIKADGQVTYFLVDLAYHQDKIINRGYTRLINIWGADHHGYIPRVKAGIVALCGDTFKAPEKFKVLLGQLVNLFRDGEPVRMSKRTGDMITFEEVIDEIGIDATRYFLIEKSPDSTIDFDLEVAKKTTFENPVFYIQYAHARICSILAKVPYVESDEIVNFLPEERHLVLSCLRAEDEIWEAAQFLAPYRVAHYTLNLAKAFHSFYEKCPLMQAPPSIQAQRLLIIKLTQKTLQACLSILDISAPEKM